MSFFKFSHRRLAKKDYSKLMKGYKASEDNLKIACRGGDEKAMRKAMKVHQSYEYALLYRETPTYRKSVRKK